MQSELAKKAINGIRDPNEYWATCGRAKGVGDLADTAYQLMKRADMDDEDDNGTLSPMTGQENGDAA